MWAFGIDGRQRQLAHLCVCGHRAATGPLKTHKDTQLTHSVPPRGGGWWGGKVVSGLIAFVRMRDGSASCHRPRVEA